MHVIVAESSPWEKKGPTNKSKSSLQTINQVEGRASTICLLIILGFFIFLIVKLQQASDIGAGYCLESDIWNTKKTNQIR